MESQFNQLRFDISEKVRLHPQQPGIGTLLELDLYPDVEIRDEGQHLKIQGYLRLNGAYVAEKTDQEEVQLHKDYDPERDSRQEIAYVIPVEITLPADRAEQDHILAEVETFDYQVLSPFELQIEAILMIDGLIPDKKGELAPDEAEKTTDEYPVFTGAPAQPLSVMGEDEFEGQKEKNEQEEAAVSPLKEQESVQPEPYTPDFKEQKFQPDYLRVEDKKERNEQVNQEKLVEQSDFQPPFSRDEQEEQSDLPGLKPQTVHDFWAERQESKHQEKMERESFQLGNEGEEREEKEEDQHTQLIGKKERTETEKQELDWIRWLVGNKEENFVSMRMVIVQKDETVDHLAEKYDVSAGQLMRINKLESDRLEEGQILYVPTPYVEENPS